MEEDRLSLKKQRSEKSQAHHDNTEKIERTKVKTWNEPLRIENSRLQSDTSDRNSGLPLEEKKATANHEARVSEQKERTTLMTALLDPLKQSRKEIPLPHKHLLIFSIVHEVLILCGRLAVSAGSSSM